MSTHVVWFRNDLRVADHAPLTNACKRAASEGGHVLPIYVMDPFWFGQTERGFPRTDAKRANFLLECLRDLDRNLREIGGKLRILCGDSSAVFADLCREVAIESVSCFHEVSTQETAIEDQVRSELSKQSVDFKAFSPATMCDWDRLPFSIPETPEVFTKFRRLVEKRGHFSPPAPVPDKFQAFPSDLVGETNCEDLKKLSWYPSDSRSNQPSDTNLFVGGITAGTARLNHYLWESDALSRYKETRNGMLAVDDSSKLSSWLAFGCLSAKQVMQEIDHYESKRVKNDSTYWLKFELLWRDFFILMSAKHGAHLYRAGGLQNKQIDWISNDDLFQAWVHGKTGYPLIDANMRELSQTGYMSNRGRQNVASFLTKNLGLDWRLGAEWFESKLIDHDPSLNYGNWNYAAGIGNDAREFRWFNTNKQAATYDPNGDYVRHWLPELHKVPSEWIHHPWRMGESLQQSADCVIGTDYPEPIVDLFHSAELNKQRYERPNRQPAKLATQGLLQF